MISGHIDEDDFEFPIFFFFFFSHICSCSESNASYFFSMETTTGQGIIKWLILGKTMKIV